MLLKAPGKHFVAQLHLLLAAIAFVIFVTKGGALLIHTMQTVIADGDFPETSSGQVMGVPSKVFYHLLRAAKGPLGIHYPVFGK
jgi:hypothetical protein